MKPTIDEIVMALRTCNNPKGRRCSSCPMLGRYDHKICKSTIDKLAASLLESFGYQDCDASALKTKADHLALQKKYDALAMAARELVAENFALKEELERAESRINSRDEYIQKMVGKWNW